MKFPQKIIDHLVQARNVLAVWKSCKWFLKEIKRLITVESNENKC